MASKQTPTTEEPQPVRRPMIPRPRVTKDAVEIGRIVARFAGDDRNFIKYGDTYPAKKQTHLIMDSKMMWRAVVTEGFEDGFLPTFHENVVPGSDDGGREAQRLVGSQRDAAQRLAQGFGKQVQITGAPHSAWAETEVEMGDGGLG